MSIAGSEGEVGPWPLAVVGEYNVTLPPISDFRLPTSDLRPPTSALSSSTPEPRSTTTDFTPVAEVGSIPEGQGITVALGDRLVAIFNSGGEYLAIDDLCPHMGASLGAGEVYDGIVTCPWHAWRFKVADGTWCDNPRIKIDSFETRVVGDEIQVRLRSNSGL